MNSKIKYSNDKYTAFSNTLRQRVNDYFETRKLSKFGNPTMVLKTIFMVSLYFIPYLLMITGIVSNPVAIFGIWVFMGFGMAGIGLSVMHDANHGSYSKHSKVNKYMSYFLDVIGGNSANWKIQHNVLHHSYTNIDDADEDINISNLMRFSPHQKRYKIHRLQYIYAWFLYSLMTLSRLMWTDISQVYRFNKRGLTSTQNKSFKSLVIELTLTKFIYISYILVLPLIFVHIPWWHTVLFFLAMHLIAGFILASIFQPAHVMPVSHYPLPDGDGNIENSWTIHQLATTTDFAPSSRIFTWFVGGLNFQIEHHLFPNICHVHYRSISKIVKQTAKDFNIGYNEQSNFIKALYNHGKMLYYLGKYDNVKPIVVKYKAN